MAASKPLAVRMLEQHRVAHEVVQFDPSIRSADGVASDTGFPPQLVYKTLVVELDPPKGKPILVMVPSTGEIDLKVMAAGLGLKKLRMASHRDAERFTGLQVGGIGALALIGKGFAVYIDQRALDEPEILVSAGQRGMDVRLAVDDLVRLTGAQPVACGQS
ncbi:MAG TPA: YbaK/EbsC family protein [Tepidiformaceae bacterium]